VIAEEVADAGLAQVAFDAITQVTISPFVGVYVNVELLVTWFTEFTFHW
jgi:hypothetical protein